MTECHRVFGIGLSRTGTLSLACALEMLGWRTAHFPHDRRTFEQLRTGDLDLDLFRCYDAVCDTPVVPHYAQLSEMFPTSKFILTVRDRDDWHASAARFWDETAIEQEDAFHRFVNTAVYGIERYERDRFDYVYDRHLASVRAHFDAAPYRLLELDICGEPDPWKPLCEFLGREHPSHQFPHQNQRR